MPSRIEHELIVPAEFARTRIDQVVASLLPQYSRSQLQNWIRRGELVVDGESVKPKDQLLGGERVQIFAEQTISEDLAEPMSLDIIHEDKSLLVVNKPAGLVVHPGAGNRTGTLLNGLLHHDSSLAGVARAGIVHRLDKDTSGLMVVAKTLETQTYLVREIQERKVSRIYHAVVYGTLRHPSGTIDEPIGRHPGQRTKMAIRRDGKHAVTGYTVKKQFENHALLECRLETGRTHQIRVHMQSIGHPLMGDVVYGGHFRRSKYMSKEVELVIRGFKRQALHARKLALVHPDTGDIVSWRVDPPDDFEELVSCLDD